MRQRLQQAQQPRPRAGRRCNEQDHVSSHMSEQKMPHGIYYNHEVWSIRRGNHQKIVSIITIITIHRSTTWVLQVITERVIACAGQTGRPHLRARQG